MVVENLLIFGILGLITGSFLNVLIYRLNTEGSPSPVWGRSFCPKCKHQLSWSDNIPLLSFFLLNGKCRYCHKAISWQYPLVEAINTVLWLLAATVFPSGLAAGLYSLAASLLLVIFFSDMLYGLIPDEANIGLAALGVAVWFGRWPDLGLGLLSGLLVAGGFTLLIILSRGKAMGLGDVKLFLAMGVLLGWQNFVFALWLAFVSGGIVAGALLLLKRKKIGATIPLGPFLVIAALTALFYGSQILATVNRLYFN